MKKHYKAAVFFGMVMTIFFIVRNILARNLATPKDYLVMIFTCLCGGLVAGVCWGFFYRNIFLNKRNSADN